MSYPATSAPSPLPQANKKSRALLVVLSAAIIVGGLGWLLSDSSGFEYYKHVDEVKQNLPAWQNKRLQLHGFVVPGSIAKRLNRDIQKLEYTFAVENCGATMQAYFAGVLPDTFKDGAEVVLKGQLFAEKFKATEVMAKCPSKYQATQGSHPTSVERCSRDSSKGS